MTTDDTTLSQVERKLLKKETKFKQNQTQTDQMNKKQPKTHNDCKELKNDNMDP